MSTLGSVVARIVIFVLGETALRQVILDLLRKFALQTNTKVDDRLVRIIEQALEDRCDVHDLEQLVGEWKESEASKTTS